MEKKNDLYFFNYFSRFFSNNNNKTKESLDNNREITCWQETKRYARVWIESSLTQTNFLVLSSSSSLISTIDFLQLVLELQLTKALYQLIDMVYISSFAIITSEKNRCILRTMSINISSWDQIVLFSHHPPTSFFLLDLINSALINRWNLLSFAPTYHFCWCHHHHHHDLCWRFFHLF